MKELPPEILDVLDRVDWSAMKVGGKFEKIRTFGADSCLCPLEAAFNLNAGMWPDAPIAAFNRIRIVRASDNSRNDVTTNAIRSEMLRRIQAKTPRAIK